MPPRPGVLRPLAAQLPSGLHGEGPMPHRRRCLRRHNHARPRRGQHRGRRAALRQARRRLPHQARRRSLARPLRGLPGGRRAQQSRRLAWHSRVMLRSGLRRGRQAQHRPPRQRWCRHQQAISRTHHRPLTVQSPGSRSGHSEGRRARRDWWRPSRRRRWSPRKGRPAARRPRAWSSRLAGPRRRRR